MDDDVFAPTVVIITIAVVIGWIMNIVDLLVHHPEISEWTTVQVFQVVGVIVYPLGAVMGWFCFF